MRKSIILAACLLAIAAGCESTGTKTPLPQQIQTLKQEKEQLTSRLEQYKTENEQLRKQVEILSEVRAGLKPEDIYRLQKINITKYTNLYDQNKDGRKEKLIVYIQPIDHHGDVIKAAGAVDVQLWDLNRQDGQALLGQWRVEPDQLAKLWFATLVIINYRLTFDLPDEPRPFEEPLTVKVTFTDYLSGKVFEEQKVIDPTKF